MTDILVRPGAAPARPTTAVLRHRDDERGGADLVAGIRSCAGRLRAAGVRPGDRVLLKAGNSTAYVVTLLALAHADASVVLVDHRQDGAGTRSIAALTGARWLVTDTRDRLDLPPDRVLPLAGAVTAAAARPEPTGPDLAPWWRRGDAVILCSSGTTGVPKCVVKSGPALLDNTARTIGALGLAPDEVIAPWLPFSHQYGLSVVISWWFAGCTLSVSPQTRPDQAVMDVITDRATIVEATPSTYRVLLRLLAARPWLRADLAGVRSWGVGGEPLPRSVAGDFRAVMGRPLLDGYGLTEVGNVALAAGDNPVGCGRPLPGVDVRVVDGTGHAVAAGEVGAIEVRSAGLMAGYLDAGGQIVPPAPGWYPTDDLGHLDRSGNLHVIGRRHAVHRRGYTLYPESIGRRAEECGRPVQVVPVDDERRGCALVFVVCDPSGGSPQEWRRRICAVLPRYEHPNRVHVVDEFPVTSNGKVDRAGLRVLVTSGPADG